MYFVSFPYNPCFVIFIQIFPSEINNILLNHPGVADSATVPVNHPKASQVPYCFVVPSNKDTVTECMLKQTLHGEYNLIVCILKFNLWRKKYNVSWYMFSHTM